MVFCHRVVTLCFSYIDQGFSKRHHVVTIIAVFPDIVFGYNGIG